MMSAVRPSALSESLRAFRLRVRSDWHSHAHIIASGTTINHGARVLCVCVRVRVRVCVCDPLALNLQEKARELNHAAVVEEDRKEKLPHNWEVSGTVQ